MALSVSSHAQLSVNKSILELTNSERTEIVRLTNTGEDTFYINVNLHEIIEPAISDTNSRELNNPVEDGVLVHPRQLILEPGQTRSVKVVVTEPVESVDRVFRLNIKPLAGDALPQGASQQAAGVRILLGYELLVLARPDKLQPNIELHRGDDHVVLQNLGNTSVLLRKISACKHADSFCADLKPNRLYPNESHRIDLPMGTDGMTATIRTRQSVQNSERVVAYEP
jgi:P pilus assembly chaperone PapD